MNLDELRTVQSKERQKDSLQNLRPSFYQEVGEYVAELEAERERVAEAADDPFSSPEVGRLTDEIETARDVVEAIYERRMGKLVKQASLAAAGMPADDEGLTAEEADLFEDLVDRIQSNKGRVLDVLDGEVPATDGDEGADPGASADPTPGRGAPAEEGDAPPAPPEEPPADGSAPAGPGSDPEPPADSSGVTAADVMSGGPDAPSEPSPPPEGSPAGGPPADEPTPEDTAPAEPPSGARSDEPSNDAGAESPAVDEGEGGNEGADVDRVTVRITRDVGSILGVDDREYTLAADDVVTLPEQNADPLVEREAAEPLE